jgi:hypothetical protein
MLVDKGRMLKTHQFEDYRGFVLDSWNTCSDSGCSIHFNLLFHLSVHLLDLGIT